MGATSPPTAAQLVAQQAALEAAKAAAIERLQAETHELVASTDARLKEITEELKALGHRRVGRPKGAESA